MLSLIARHNVWFSLFCFRYLRLFINLFAFLKLRPIPPPDPERRTLGPKDVSVIIPTLNGDGIEETLASILATDPYVVYLVTIDANFSKASAMVKRMEAQDMVTVLSISYPNKRRQMVRAIPQVKTKVTIFADDDVIWPSTLIPHMLAPLEDEKYGGVGTNQRLKRSVSPTFQQAIYEFLGAVYLQRRNFDCTACIYMDGGLPCLSGRTVAYRTKIINDPAFTEGFTNESWGCFRNYRLNTDDDNFITRWLDSHGHGIAFQYHKDAEVLTELENNSKFLKQCLRWSRSNWRSNITSMFVEGHVWMQHPWSVYAVFQTTFTHWTFLWDVGLWYFIPEDNAVFWSFLAVYLLSKTVKLMPLFVRKPGDLLLLGVSFIFGFLHGFIKLHAGLTLHETAWGSRDGADDDDAFRMILQDRSKFSPEGEKPITLEQPKICRSEEMSAMMPCLGAKSLSLRPQA